jgi:hypothetical protein
MELLVLLLGHSAASMVSLVESNVGGFAARRMEIETMLGRIEDVIRDSRERTDTLSNFLTFCDSGPSDGILHYAALAGEEGGEYQQRLGDPAICALLRRDSDILSTVEYQRSKYRELIRMYSQWEERSRHALSSSEHDILASYGHEELLLTKTLRDIHARERQKRELIYRFWRALYSIGTQRPRPTEPKKILPYSRTSVEAGHIRSFVTDFLKSRLDTARLHREIVEMRDEYTVASLESAILSVISEVFLGHMNELKRKVVELENQLLGESSVA